MNTSEFSDKLRELVNAAATPAMDDAQRLAGLSLVNDLTMAYHTLYYNNLDLKRQIRNAPATPVDDDIDIIYDNGKD